MTESVWKGVAHWWRSGDGASSRREGGGFDGRGLLRDAVKSRLGLTRARAEGAAAMHYNNNDLNILGVC